MELPVEEGALGLSAEDGGVEGEAVDAGAGDAVELGEVAVGDGLGEGDDGGVVLGVVGDEEVDVLGEADGARAPVADLEDVECGCDGALDDGAG